MIAILRVTGLRRSEVVALELTDFDTKTGELLVRCGKEEARTVYLPKGASCCIGLVENQGKAPGLYCVRFID